jgi:pimeloyl-ACP methyl ester carboxylesterase
MTTRFEFACVALTLSFATGCADRLILYPPSDAKAGPGVERRTLERAGKTIEIFTARSGGAKDVEPRAFMLEFTGNATRAEFIVAYVASRWQQRPVETWVVNYPGYGGSTGPARLRDIPPTALAAYDELRAVAGDRPIIVAGQSLGSVAALYVAAHRPVAGTIIQNAPPLPDVIWGHYGWWNLWLLATPVALQIPRDMNSLINAKHAITPALIVISGADRTVPARFQRKVADAYAGEKRLMVRADADHNTPLSDADEVRFREGLYWLFDRVTTRE